MDDKIATNDVFKNVITLMRIHKDRDYLIELFAQQGWDVSKAKLKAWTVKAGHYNKDFRPMPKAALEAFFRALHDAKIVDMDDD